MSININQKLIDILNDVVEPISEHSNKYSSLLDKVGDSRFVLIGEESHGTHEFYQSRAEITQQLITHKGFMAVAIEGDWPDTYNVHRYLQGVGDKSDSQQSLSEFKRFPLWMWRNTALSPFFEWLRTYNDNLTAAQHKIGFYGMDLYSLNSSMQSVIDYLSTVDPEEAERAKERYNCFDHLSCEAQSYGYLVNSGLKKSCMNEAIQQVLELQYHALDYSQHGEMGIDNFFNASQNARLVKDAERYYRAMFEGRELTWNIRDQHMFETLNTLSDHLEKKFKKPAKIVVWAHNSHVGDARATEMGTNGELNLGQLIREYHDEGETFLLGFSTYQGSVTAAYEWGGPAENKKVNPGLPGSYEELFHHVKYKNFLLDLKNRDKLEHLFKLPRLQRAIGVIYRPESERISHYFFTRLIYQFDALIHMDKTTAVTPLDITPEWALLDPS